MAWNYISINRSIFDRKKFQITVGPSGPSVFRKEGLMRYHYEKPKLYSTIYGYTYRCDHPVYYVGLKMKPIKRERWETCFDRRLI